MNRAFLISLGLALSVLGFQPSYGCAVFLAGSKEALANERAVRQLERNLARAARTADTVIEGVFTEVPAEPTDDPYQVARGILAVEKVVRGTAGNEVRITFTPYDFSCAPQFLPENGERARYYVRSGHLVAANKLGL